MLAVVLVASSTTAGAATKFVFAQLFLPNACLVVVCLESNANAFIPLVLCHSLLFYKYSLFLYSQHRLLFSGVYAIYSSNTWPRVIFVMSRFCNRVMQYELRIAVFFWPNSYIAPAQCMWPWLARWGKEQNKTNWDEKHTVWKSELHTHASRFCISILMCIRKIRTDGSGQISSFFSSTYLSLVRLDECLSYLPDRVLCLTLADGNRNA